MTWIQRKLVGAALVAAAVGGGLYGYNERLKHVTAELNGQHAVADRERTIGQLTVERDDARVRISSLDDALASKTCGTCDDRATWTYAVEREGPSGAETYFLLDRPVGLRKEVKTLTLGNGRLIAHGFTFNVPLDERFEAAFYGTSTEQRRQAIEILEARQAMYVQERTR